jgi:3-oxoacyl-[acyl-carrier-protein] synthase II
MERRRVVITGIGALTPIGHGKNGLWQGICQRKSGIQTITRFDTTHIRVKVAGEINDFSPENYLDNRSLKRIDRFAQFALVAARMAVDDTHLTNGERQRNPRIGVTMGTALGGVSGAEEQHASFLKEGLRAINPALAFMVFGGATASNIAIEYGFTGPSNTNSNSCSSGTIAIGEAFRYIRDGYADVMLAGGAEAPLCELTFSAFAIIRAMSTNADAAKACRPFDKQRDGFVMGEGAAVLVLEELGHAIRRDAPIYAEVLGYACNNDAYHLVAPLPSGESAARAMSDALHEAKISPSDVGYVNAHASSTHLNDKTETAAMKQVFGEHAHKVPVSGTKAMHAHALGATGAIEAAICCLAFEHSYIPPTLNLETADPDCDLDYVPNVGRHAHVDYILSNSFGFGGINASLVFGKIRS